MLLIMIMEMLLLMLLALDITIYSLNLNITAVYSDDNFAYHHVVTFSHTLRTGKINTQKIERKHLSFRTRLKRLARKTICFSKATPHKKTKA